MRRAEAKLRPLAESTEPWCEPRLPLDTKRLAECMQRLGDRDRSVIALTFSDELGAPEVAAAIGTSAGNVRIIRHRALAALRECIDGRAS
jgi:RNA polymerase sigma-70 factor, ECF subfamily